MIFRLKVFVIMATLAMILSNSTARAQGTPERVQLAIPTNQAAEVAVAPENIPALIQSLAVDLPVITQVRVFANGEMLNDGYAPTIERKEGSFNPAMMTLQILGAFGGSPVVEDMRLLAHDGVFYVLSDVYLDRKTIETTPGRLLPTRLETELSSNQGKVTQGTTFSPMVVTAVTPPTPTITSVGGNRITGITNNGAIAIPSCGTSDNGWFVVNTIAATNLGRQLPEPNTWTSWTITGKNFGTATGTIQVAGLTFTASSMVYPSSNQHSIQNWTQNQIILVPSATAGFQITPLVMVLKITTATSPATSASYVVGGLAPAIGTRVFGQCTWFAGYMRILMGKYPPDTAYPPSATNGDGGWYQIAPSYVPQVGDVLVWLWSNEQHTAIITNVSPAGLATWTVMIGEMNYNCQNQVYSGPLPDSSTFQVKTVNGKPTIVSGIYSKAVANLGASWYFR